MFCIHKIHDTDVRLKRDTTRSRQRFSHPLKYSSIGFGFGLCVRHHSLCNNKTCTLYWISESETMMMVVVVMPVLCLRCHVLANEYYSHLVWWCLWNSEHCKFLADVVVAVVRMLVLLSRNGFGAFSSMLPPMLIIKIETASILCRHWHEHFD